MYLPPPPVSLYVLYKILFIYQFIKPSGNLFISSRFEGGGGGVNREERGLIQKGEMVVSVFDKE